MASVLPAFAGPGKDIFTCSFSPLSEQNVQLQYNVLWKVNGQFIYEDAVNAVTLPSNFSDIANGDVVRLVTFFCRLAF